MLHIISRATEKKFNQNLLNIISVLIAYGADLTAQSADQTAYEQLDSLVPDRNAFINESKVKYNNKLLK